MSARLNPDWECVLSSAEVEAGFDRLAAAIQPHVDAGHCTLLGVMTGGMYTLIRLAMKLQGDFLLDYCHAARYGDSMIGGRLEWLREPSLDMHRRTIIVVDDIWDAGETLAAVAGLCAGGNPARVLTAVAFIKDRERPPGSRPPDLDAGLHVPDRYVFGCGMDLNSHWRHWPAVYALPRDPEVRR